MSENNDDGGGAFPREDYQPGEDREGQRGMSLRDYFAGQALIAMGMWCPNQAGADNPPRSHKEIREARARYAYQQADALLKARGE